VSWQPTPQNGHRLSTVRSAYSVRVCASSSSDRRHQRAGRAGLHALAAGDARAVAHRVVEVEHDLLVMAADGHADHVVDLDLAAGADAEIAVDAGVEVHRHRRMADVHHRPLVLRGSGWW
jgi:hypothetical protein